MISQLTDLPALLQRLSDELQQHQSVGHRVFGLEKRVQAILNTWRSFLMQNFATNPRHWIRRGYRDIEYVPWISGK